MKVRGRVINLIYLIKHEFFFPYCQCAYSHLKFSHKNTHSTVVLKENFENIPLKSCNIAKIFLTLLERFLKYCRNLAMSVQNIINGILIY